MLEYVRWVMVRKRDEAAPAPGDHVPRLPTVLDPKVLGEACPPLDIAAYDFALAGSPYRFGDYEVGEKIDHVDGITVEEAEHQIATRLYQNTARIHFDQFGAKQGRFGRRLIYGGHVISLARALSFNGLANAFHVAAINGGRHVAPLFAGGTVFAWSEVLAKAELPGRDDVGALRLRTVATNDKPCADFPLKTGDEYDPAVLLDLDYWVLMPRAGHSLPSTSARRANARRVAAHRAAVRRRLRMQIVRSRTAQGSDSVHRLDRHGLRHAARRRFRHDADADLAFDQPAYRVEAAQLHAQPQRPADAHGLGGEEALHRAGAVEADEIVLEHVFESRSCVRLASG